MVYIAPLHKPTQDRWCTRHHCTTRLRLVVHSTTAQAYKHTQTDGVHNTNAQTGLEWIVYIAPLHKHTQTDGVHGTSAQTGSPEPVDFKISSWLYCASHCQRTKQVCTKHNLPIKTPLFRLHA